MFVAVQPARKAWTGGAGRPQAHVRGYDWKWRKYRADFLARNPACVVCGAKASTVDHIRPHLGRQRLFWDTKNHQPMCRSCHSKKTRIGKAATTEHPSRVPNWKRLHEIADSWVPKMEASILGFFSLAQRGLSLGLLEEAFSSRDTMTATRLADEAWDRAEAGLRLELPEMLRDILERSGKTTAEKTILKQSVPAIGLRFDVTDTEASAFILNEVARMVTNVSSETREGIRQAIEDSFLHGRTAAESARRIRSLVGLSRRDAIAVSNLERTLRGRLESQLSVDDSSALLNSLRRSRAILDARNGNIDRVLTRYSDRLRRDRAKTIARTETINAASEGQRQSWIQGAKQGLIGPDFVVRWLITPDDRLAIVGGKKKVLTISGWKSISKIQPGEFVLTHKDRFCKVVSIDKRHYGGPTVKIDMGGRAGQRVTVTANHEILVHRNGIDEWVEAQHLKDNDEFYTTAKPCADCGKLIPHGYIVSTEVCGSCSALRSNKSRWSSLEEREKLRQQNIKRWAVPGAREKARKDWLRMLDERGEEIIGKALSARAKNRFGHSYLERKMKWWLDKQEIPYRPQVYFPYFYQGKMRRSWLDFHIPGRNIVIECDGPTHQDPQVMERDRAKDVALKMRGIKVLRFTDKEIRGEFPKVASSIRQHCCLLRRKAKSIVRSETNHQPCYDLQVDGDESFVAGGIVVHNCQLCREMMPMVREIDGSYPNGIKRPTRHARCRCSESVIRRSELTSANEAPKPKLQAEPPPLN